MKSYSHGQQCKCNDARRTLPRGLRPTACPQGILTVFVFCRNPSISRTKLPNKGKLQEAIDGQQNLICMAWELRAPPNKISPSQLDNMELEYDMELEDDASINDVANNLLLLGDVAVTTANINQAESSDEEPLYSSDEE